LAASQKGFKSLGPATDNVTKGQHCRAEVYLADLGWVPVDPADVRKVMLEEPPGNRTLADELVRQARTQLFGSWEMNWMAYNCSLAMLLCSKTSREGRRVSTFSRPAGQTLRAAKISLAARSKEDL
jgi:hypothetical protein